MANPAFSPPAGEGWGEGLWAKLNRHAEAQALHDYTVTIADEAAGSRLLQPSVGEGNGA
jgi:hypothetical protein